MITYIYCFHIIAFYNIIHSKNIVRKSRLSLFVPFQDGKRNAEAFVFLNHYLDLTDAIVDGQNEMIDDTDLQCTDFPTNVPLPQTMYVENEQHEQVREWILTNAMDRDVSQVKNNIFVFIIIF